MPTASTRGIARPELSRHAPNVLRPAADVRRPRTLAAPMGEGDLRRLLTRVPIAVWAVLAVALYAGLATFTAPDRLALTLGDTDDATRLVQVRELMGGAPLFDTRLTRFGLDEPLVSHWSRLVDLPIALLMWLGSLVSDAATSETFARFAWPMLVLTALVALVAGEAAQRAGRAAGFAAIALLLTSLSALVQFAPGRIDHHNVLILGSVGGALFLLRSLRQPQAGTLAGVMLGLAVAVGLEALPLAAAALALATLAAAVRAAPAGGPWRASVAFTATLAAALVATKAPSQLLEFPCDALGSNLVLLAGAGTAAAFVAINRKIAISVAVRLALAGVVMAAGVAAYGTVSPACLAGPFGAMDAAADALWLGNVMETQSAFRLVTTRPETVVPVATFAIFAALGLAAAVASALRRGHSTADVVTAALVAVMTGLALWQMKFAPYAAALAAFALAVSIGRLRRRGDLSAGTRRAVATLLASQWAIAAVVLGATAALATVPTDRRGREAQAAGEARLAAKRDCLATASYAPLARLPAGRALNQRDLGPYLVALTRLDVAAAPYHRMARSIVEAERILVLPADDARRDLVRLGADYIVLCPALAMGESAPRGSLRHALLAGEAPDYLAPLGFGQGTPIRVWRVVDPETPASLR